MLYVLVLKIFVIFYPSIIKCRRFGHYTLKLNPNLQNAECELNLHQKTGRDKYIFVVYCSFLGLIIPSVLHDSKYIFMVIISDK